MAPAQNRVPSVAVAIPSCQRPGPLIATVQALAELQHPPEEILVVEQSPDEVFVSICDALREIGRVPVRILRQETPNLPQARNRALQEAKAGIVLFVDDDVALRSELVTLHARHYQDPQVAVVGGRVIEDPDPITNYRRRPGGTFSITGRGLRNFGDVRTADADWVMGCNLSVRRETALECGGFDARFLETAVLEDSDFCYRVRRHGYRVVFDGEAALHHLREPAGGCREQKRSHWEFLRYRNTMLFHLENLPTARLPLFIASFVAVAIKNAAIRRIPWAELPYVLSGLCAGYKTACNLPAPDSPAKSKGPSL